MADNQVKTGGEGDILLKISQRIREESARLARKFSRIVNYGIKSERLWYFLMRMKKAYVYKHHPRLFRTIRNNPEIRKKVEQNPELLDEIEEHPEIFDALRQEHGERYVREVSADMREHPKLLYLFRKHREMLGWIGFSIIVGVLVVLCYIVISVFTAPIFKEEEFRGMTRVIVLSNIVPYFFILLSLLLFKTLFMKPKIKEANILNVVFQQINKIMKKKITWYNIKDEILELGMNHPLSLFIVGLIENASNPYSRGIHSVYRICRTKEEERLERIVDGSRRRLVRIVRLGIIGTFWGLLTSFYLSAKTLESGAEVDMLVQSLSGYALAVLSSIAANVISILYEVGRIKSVRGNDEVLNWIDAVYNEFLLNPPEYAVMKAMPDRVIADIMQACVDIKKLFKEIEEAIKRSKEGIEGSGQGVSDSADELIALVKNTKVMVNSFRDIMYKKPEDFEEDYPGGKIPEKDRGLIDESINLIRNVNLINIQGDKIIEAIEKSNISEHVVSLSEEVEKVIEGLQSAETVLDNIKKYAADNKLPELKEVSDEILGKMTNLRQSWQMFQANLFGRKTK